MFEVRNVAKFFAEHGSTLTKEELFGLHVKLGALRP